MRPGVLVVFLSFVISIFSVPLVHGHGVCGEEIFPLNHYLGRLATRAGLLVYFPA
jgi:hypothetical protein